MKKVFSNKRIEEAIAKSKYRNMLEALPVRLFLLEYEPGEFAYAPESDRRYFQIIVSGSMLIYHVRDDGSVYSLAVSERDDILGETDFFHVDYEGVHAEVTRKTTCLAFDIEENREALLKNADFLRVLAESLVKKTQVSITQNSLGSLKERVLAYMRYRCENGTLKGVEHAAFHLHCSSRQLQRILNDYVREGVVIKTGKGTYAISEYVCEMFEINTNT